MCDLGTACLTCQSFSFLPCKMDYQHHTLPVITGGAKQMNNDNTPLGTCAFEQEAQQDHPCNVLHIHSEAQSELENTIVQY